MTFHRLFALLALSAVLLGCSPSKPRAAAPASAPPEASAWWKTESVGTATAGVAESPVGAPMSGWAQLPPVSARLAKEGEAVFASRGCKACHSIGHGQVVGGDLLGVTHRIQPDWMARFIADPPALLASDPYAKGLLAKYLVRMPKLPVTPSEIRALQELFRERDQAAVTGASAPATK